MSVRLSDDEAWAVIEGAHTGILTTLRKDGSPITLPVWFVVLDRMICMRTPARTKKVKRIRRDPRASFLVEAGERWAELEAVHLNGTVEIVDGDETLEKQIEQGLDEKYAAFRTPREEMSDAARAAYSDYAYLRLVPEGRMLTWDNRRA